jgi:hypothetical protein
MGLKILVSSGSNMDWLPTIGTLQHTRACEQLSKSLLFPMSVLEELECTLLNLISFPYSRPLFLTIVAC